MRLHAQTATIENGFVHLPEEAHWLPDYLSELAELDPLGGYGEAKRLESFGWDPKGRHYGGGAEAA